MPRKPPVRRPGETDDAFYARVLSYEVYQDRERERCKRRAATQARKEYMRKWAKDHYISRPKTESAREKAKLQYAKHKDSGDYTYYEKLLRAKCLASAKRLECPPDSEYYSGERGKKRFYRDIERAFMYGVFRLNSELEAAETERERSCQHSLAEREYLERRGIYRMSSSERIIFDLLNDAGIAFEREKTFDWLLSSTTGGAYRVDFYIPLLSTAIEYNGPQHYVQRFGMPVDDLIYRQTADIEKCELLEAHGIRVIVIHSDARDANAIRTILEREGVIHGRIDRK